MKLATRANGTPDGELMVVSQDGARWLPVGARWPSLLAAIARWQAAEADLRVLDARLAAGEGTRIDAAELRAPLPRTWQWLDASVFPVHAELMQVAFATPRIQAEKPLMYQGISDRFYGPFEQVPFPDVAHGIDFEGEYAAVVDEVPMGCSVEAAARHIRLLVQVNDWSLRNLAVAEMKTGFGWIQAKPACSMAAFAVTPDSLAPHWRAGRLELPLHIDWNGQAFGRANGREMGYSFQQLIAHAAATRDLVAGTVIGSGTIANADHAEMGSSCISERRAIEIITRGAPKTAFMAFGDRVRMAARLPDGSEPFGCIDQQVVSARAS